MSEPSFLSFEEVLELHRESIARYGGRDGLRDRGGFESAVEQPKNTYFYGCGDLFDIAAAYAFHIAQAQAFLDGNKRTAVGAALLFLKFNGVVGLFDQWKIYTQVIGIAERRLDKLDLANLLRARVSSP